MSGYPDSRLLGWLWLVPRVASVWIIVIAALALVGWQLEVELFKSFLHPNRIAMNPVTAVAFVLCGAALWLLHPLDAGRARRRTGMVLAGLVASLAMVKLLALGLEWNARLDTWLLSNRLGENRMAPNTALCFLLGGTALLLLDVPIRKRHTASTACGFLLAAIALLSLTGYLYDSRALYRVSSYIAMAVNTAISFAVLAAGILAARPNREPAETIFSATAGGLAARRLLPAAFFVPFAVGLLRLWGQHAGWYDMELGLSLLTLANVVVFSTLIWLSARALYRIDGERRRAREELQEQNARLKETVRSEQAAYQALRENSKALANERYLVHSLLENIPDNIYFKDREGRYLRISRAKAERSGLTDPADAVGKTDFDFFPEQHARKTFEDEQELMRSGEPLIGVEEHLVWPDGSETWSSTTKVPMRDQSGRVAGTLGISRDITVRKLAERELRLAKESAESSSRAKSDFLANMSHEIRTPMNAIIGMTELVLDTQLSTAQREYLIMVLESAESLLSVINDILDFSKIEAGKLDLEDAAIGIRDMLGDTMRSLALRAHRQGLELACRIRPDVPDAVRGDATRLRQVIVNLVGNAIKFTERGEVVLDVEREAADPEVVLLHFSVSDTGIGISQDKLAAIFDAFEQADTSTTRRFGGTGLGLTISSRLVELMGGRIWVDSTPGEGSTFHFTARFGVADETAVPPPAVPVVARMQGMRALVVDDNATNRRILEEVLSNWRVRPASVAGAREALDAMRTAQQAGDPFHLVLTDANMPDVDGFTLAEAIKQDPDLGGAIIMMLTSGARSGDIARCESLGIAAHLLKPVKQSDLFDAIAGAVGLTADEESLPVNESSGPTRQLGPLRILLAEDSPINQKLAVDLLTRWGHSVAVAHNGREAVELSGKECYDVVLMDVQMPELDGLEATGQIREREQQGGGHLPIIAMTAHAMKGDREMCLEAGMDHYVAKPVRAVELHAALEQVVQPPRDAAQQPAERKQDAQPAAGPHQADGEMLLDWNAALERLQGREDTLRELAALFLEECPRMMDSIEQALAAGERQSLQRAAHTIKGSADIFSAKSLVESAWTLESVARDGRMEDAPEAWSRLKAEVSRFTPALAEHADTNGG